MRGIKLKITGRIGREIIPKALKLIIYYIFFNLILYPSTISLHEWGHWAIAWILNYRKGYVKFYPSGGVFIPCEILRSSIDGLLIGLGGGLTVAFIFTVIYLFLDWETDEIEKCVLRNYILHQAVYGLFEALYGFGLFDIFILEVVSITIYPICLYATLIYLFIKYLKKYGF
jgi:hypothetical protein